MKKRPILGAFEESISNAPVPCGWVPFDPHLNLAEVLTVRICRKLSKTLAICAIAAAAVAARADELEYSLVVGSSVPNLATQQQTTNLPGTILSAVSASQGTDAYGRTYMGSAMAEGNGNSLSLEASSSLSGGGVSPYGVAAAQAEAYANMSFDFIIPAGVYFISEGIGADGHGMSVTGPSGYVSGGALMEMYDPEIADDLECGVGLDGGDESNSCGPFAVTPGNYETFYLGGEIIASSFQPGDSASMNYWGTFTPSIDYYDANGDLIGQYDFPAPAATPEPSTLVMLGSGLLGLAGIVRRRIRL